MKSKNNITDINDAMRDVRKAFRLLYSYQCKIRDLMRFISALVSRNCEYGYSRFSHSRSHKTATPLDYWIWDWLGMYFYEFKFEDTSIGNDKYSFSIWLVSDTGFFDKEPQGSKPKGKARLNLENYASTDESATKLIFAATKNASMDDFSDFYINQRKDSDAEYSRRIANKILLCKSYDISSFINEAETRKTVADFIAFCGKNGIKEITLAELKD